MLSSAKFLRESARKSFNNRIDLDPKRGWNTFQVVRWARKLDLMHEDLAILMQHEIDGETLSCTSLQKLMKFGMNPSAARKITAALGRRSSLGKSLYLLFIA